MNLPHVPTRTLLIAGALSFLIVLLEIAQLTYPFTLSDRLLRYTVFSASLMLPVFLEGAANAIGITFGQDVFYVMSFVVYGALFTALIVLFNRSANKKKFVSLVSVCIIAYLAISVVSLM